MTELRGPGPERLILVIEDDYATAHLLTVQLSQRGFRVEVMAEAAGALDAACALSPDLITLDINLSPGSGFDVLRELREVPQTAAIPVVFISVSDQRERAKEAGADGFIMKPYWPDTLYSVVDRLLPPPAQPPRLIRPESPFTPQG